MSCQAMSGICLVTSPVSVDAASPMISSSRSEACCKIESSAYHLCPVRRSGPVRLLRGECQRSAVRRNGSQGYCVSENVFVSRLETADGHDVNITPEKCTKRLFEVQEVEQGATSVELDEEVNVAGGSVLSSGHGAEQCCGSTAMLVNEGVDIVQVGVDEIAPRAHILRVSLQRLAARTDHDCCPARHV